MSRRVSSTRARVLTVDAVLVRGQYPNEVENVTAPAITGIPAVGQTLTASPGTWNLTATTFRYQWFAGSTPRLTVNVTAKRSVEIATG